MIRRAFVAGLLLVALAAAAQAVSPALPSAEWVLEEVKTLASSPMDGRAAGTPGGDRAAEHVAAVFRAAGLTPAGEAGTFLQSFTVPLATRLGASNAFAVRGPATRSLGLGTDWTPLAASANGVAAGDVIFVGYGITAPDLGYDDYAGVDARGKIVIAMRREPRSQDSASPFRRPAARQYAEREYKIVNARHHGAAAILLVPHPRHDTPLPVVRGHGRAQGIVAAAVTRSAADSLLAPSGLGLLELADAIDGDMVPRSAAVPGVTLRVEVELVRSQARTQNVVGLLPGTDPASRDQAIVIGAHYDHLGHGGNASMAPEQHGQVHPGADDNASGTVGVMALARAFAAAGGAPRTLVFVAFGGEELGLLGSAEYVRRPAVPLDKTVLMVNLDMIGRLREGRLRVGGIDSGAGLRALVTQAAGGLSLDLELPSSPFGPSDHVSFYVAGVPVLFFFTGAHGDYHRPSDTWDRVNARGIVTVATLVSRVVSAVAAASTTPAYVKLDPPRDRGRGSAPLLGVVPDFGQTGRPGLRITGVRPDSPAERAGLRSGDVIVKFAALDIRTLEDLMYGLRAQRPGDEVEVRVIRDDREQMMKAVLAERP